MYQTNIQKLDHYGRGICFINEKITFVSNTLPNEIVNIELIKENKKYNEGKLINIVKKSSNRLEPICPYFNLCGGCNLMHISYNEELEYKENKIKELINKFTNIDVNKVKKIIYDSELYYRNKATFQVKEKIGYYKEKSYDLISIDNCFLVDERINNILNEIKNYSLKNIYQIVIRVGNNDSMVVLKTNGDYDKKIIDLNVGNIVVYCNNKYKNIKGNGYIIDNIGDYQYMISPDSFFQVNTKCAYKLYSKIKEYVNQSNNLLDLYCGTGSIGIFLSDICDKIFGVEINSYAVEDAKKNAKLNNVNNIEFLCSDTSNLKEIKNFDTIIVDPPRSGLDNKTINYLTDSNANKIVYVSCDPVTLARDLKILNSKYNIEEITPVNMFSKTYHVECVCLLKII